MSSMLFLWGVLLLRSISTVGNSAFYAYLCKANYAPARALSN